jgi:WD40 repeat protein
MDYKQKYLKYKQKYLRLLKDQKGGEPFLIDLSAKQAYLWLFNKNQRQLELIFTRRQITFTMPLGNITLNHQYRLGLLTKGSLSVILVSRLVGVERRNMQLEKRILSRLHVLPPISLPTCVATLRAHANGVISVAFHPTLPLLASGCVDNTVKIWDCTDPRNPTQIANLKGHTNIVWSIAFHSTLPLLASGSNDRTIKLWDCTDPQNPIQIAELTEHTNKVTSVAFHPTLSLLASGSWDETVKLWDCTNPQNPTQIANLTKHTDRYSTVNMSWVESVAFHPTLPILASCSDNYVHLWDYKNPRTPIQVNLVEHTNLIASVAFHPTLPLLASGSHDRNIKLWDCTNLRNSTRIAHLTGDNIWSWVNSVAFHPTLPILASGTRDETVKLWDYTNPKNPTRIANLTGHTDSVTSVAFHLTLPLLASCSDDTIKIWR